ncbi:InlB B-repeat-containing protein [Treponema denticola]|uniref:InlB B-repeat-containing protein n=1 Tax=Treponema denticola TaxID=158 RepID=UPI0021022ACF|nr:InlB B-repeat-containing protein [Treponema denticola]UTY23628.1 hypothetical protein E4N78_05385 [Treponema denticola]
MKRLLKILTAAFAVILLFTTCKQFMEDPEEFFSYWASETFVKSHSIGSVYRPDGVGVPCVSSSADVLITLTVYNPKNFPFVMPTSSEPEGIIEFKELSEQPKAGTYYELKQTGPGTLELTYKSSLLQKYEQGSGGLNPTITLKAADGRVFKKTYTFGIKSNTPPPKPAVVLAKTNTSPSKYVLCFKFDSAEMAKTVTTGSGTVPVHKDIAKITINGSSYSLLYNNNNLDFQKPVEAFEIGSFIGSGEVEKLTSSSPNVPSGAWVLYFKTDIKVESSNPQTSYTITLSDKEGVVSDSLTAELKEKFKVEFNAKDGTPEPDTQYIENGGKVTEPPNPAQAGYTFGGWYKNADCSDGQEWNFATDTVTGNMTLYAKWVPGNGTPYMVEHYQQNVENNSYTLAGTETKYGTTGGAINANDIKKEYQGFDYVSMDPDPATIAADGNTVVKLYYNRKTYNVTFSVDGSNGSISATNVIGGTGSTSPVTVKYGGSITFTAMPNTGYAVDSWTGATVDTSNNKKATLSNVSADTTVTVRFKKVYTVTFRVVDGKGGSLQGSYGGLTKIANYNNDGSEQEFTNVSNGSTVTFNAVPLGSVPSAWEIEGWTASAGTLSGGGTGTTATLTVTDNATVTVEFKKVTVVEGTNNLAWTLLQNAVKVADPNSTITIDGKIEASSGNSGEILIDKTLTIKGKTGAGRDILNANTMSRIFKVASGKVLTLENLTLTGGKATGTGDAGCGGAIFARDASEIKIENCIITGNEAGTNGGGLNVEGTPTTITNCTFTGNTAKNGGGIYIIGASSYPVVTISGGTIGGTDTDKANKATGTGSDGNGGGIYVGNLCKVILQNNGSTGCTIKGNTAQRGGGVYANNADVIMKDNTRIAVDNDVYLDGMSPSNARITVTAPLTAEDSVARITVPNNQYLPSTKVLDGNAALLSSEHGKFAVTPNNSEHWTVGSNGRLTKDKTDVFDNITKDQIKAAIDAAIAAASSMIYGENATIDRTELYGKLVLYRTKRNGHFNYGIMHVTNVNNSGGGYIKFNYKTFRAYETDVLQENNKVVNGDAKFDLDTGNVNVNGSDFHLENTTSQKRFKVLDDAKFYILSN